MKLQRAIEFFALLALVWSLLSYGLHVQAHFLPAPHQMAITLAHVIHTTDFWWDCTVSLARVVFCVLLSAAIALPVGFLIARGGRFWSVMDAGVSFIRYLPPAGFVPLTILWLGIDESQKAAVLFIGTFFQLAPMITQAAVSVDRRWVEIGRLAGAVGWKEWRFVTFPASAPHVLDAIRVSFGIAWTYLTVAEIVAAHSGLGHRIVVAQRYLQTDQMLIAIIMIGLLGLMTDWSLHYLSSRLYPWFRETSSGQLS